MKKMTISLLAATVATCMGAYAQEQATQTDAVTNKPNVEVTISRLQVDDNVYTPYYKVETALDNQQGSSQRWIRLAVEYETTGGWIDELTIKHFALVSDSEFGGSTPVVLVEEVTYISVGPGRHYSHVYMHPNCVKRYKVEAFDLDSAAQFSINGKIAGFIETNKNGKKGWPTNSDKTIFKGHLLNQTETPFWFINYDFKEVVKQNPNANHETTQ
jgi:hypothetical protein